MIDENRFEFKGITLTAVGKLSCRGCFFEPIRGECTNLRREGLRPPCTNDDRQDKTASIFIKEEIDLKDKKVPNFVVNQVFQGLKIVHYFKHQLHVPKTVSWLATDKNGNLYGYWSEPALVTTKWIASSDKNYIKLGSIQYRGDWKESLVEV